MKRMQRTIVLALALAVATPVLAGTTPKIASRINDARQVLTTAVNTPDKGIPKELLENAECVGVFPGLKKGAFVVGGEYGKGVFTCRQPDGTMSAPAFFTLAGGSVGWQFGGKSVDLVLLVMNRNGVNHLLADKVTLGGEASAVAGPVGRSAQAATDAQLHAQILSWSRSQGAFLGASIKGDVIKPDNDAIESFYGKPLSARDVLVDGKAGVPSDAKAFVRAATKYTERDDQS